VSDETGGAPGFFGDPPHRRSLKAVGSDDTEHRFDDQAASLIRIHNLRHEMAVSTL
jgi:hypothetical protein